MCEYCGCQVLTAIDQLTREDDLVVRLISQVRSAAAASDTPRMAQLARGIAAVLGTHNQLEDDRLFPVLEADFPERSAVLRAEHLSVEAVLEEASAGTPADPDWPDRLTEALSLLREHIVQEQDGVFPAALANLATSRWEAIEEAR